MGENLKISIFFSGSPQNICIFFRIPLPSPLPSDNKIFLDVIYNSVIKLPYFFVKKLPLILLLVKYFM